MDALADTRLALRRLLRDPAYFAAAVTVFALSIGALTAISSAVHAVLLEPWPIAQADRVVICWKSAPSRSEPVVEVSYADYQAWSAGNQSLAKAAAVGSSTWPAVLETSNGSVKLAATGVSSTFFDLLGVPPWLGAEPGLDADAPNAPRVAVLAYNTWRSRFGSDPAIVGTFIQLDDQPHRIVGVMAPGFDFPHGTDVWLPVVPILRASSARWQTDALSNVGVLFVLGRLRTGVTAQMAAEDLARVEDSRGPIGSSAPGSRVSATTLPDYWLGPTRQALWWLLAAGVALIAIACANVSALMLARAARRQRDAVTRLALGATRARLARLFVIEALILTVVGAGVAALVARWLAAGVASFAPADLPRLTNITIDLRMLGLAAGVALIAAVISAVGPIWQIRSIDAGAALKDAAPGLTSHSSQRAQSRLVIAQVTLSVALLIVGSLMAASFARLSALNWGFDAAGVVTMTVTPRSDRPAPGWMNDLTRTIEALPNVRNAGAVSLRPLRLGAIGQETRVAAAGRTDPALANLAFNLEVVTPGYFQALGIGLERGRFFDERDTDQTVPVAVLSRGAAEQLWPGLDPIGREVMVSDDAAGPNGRPGLRRRVVGIVSDVRYRGLQDVRRDVYEPARQSALLPTDLVVRASGDPAAAIAAIKTRIGQFDPHAIVDAVTTMDAVVSRAIAPWRFNAWLFGLLASLSFVLAAAGLFGLVTLYTTGRAREFAVRMAFGAGERDIVAQVLTVAGRHAAVGCTFGVIVAAVAARWTESVLFGVRAFDPAIYLGVVLVVFAVAACASYLPARQAGRLDPLTLLRRP